MPPEPSTQERLLEEMGWVRALASSLVVDPNVADDLAQETWLSASRELHRSADVSRGWLARVLRNRLRSRRVAERRRARREAETAGHGPPASPEELTARMEAQRLLAEAVLRLEEPYRSTVILRYSEELEPTEIARRLDVPPGTVRSRLKRALEQLRRDLDARHEGGREGWSLALAPWPAAEVSIGTAGVPVTLAGGALVMKKVVVAVVALALLGSGWAVRERVLEQDRETARAPEPDRSPVVGAGAEAASGASGGSERREAAGPASPAPPEPTFGSRPGWWLVGRVRGVAPDAPGTTRVEAESVEDPAGADGRVEMDLAPIFGAERGLPSSLEVRVRREGYVPATVELEVDRAFRQAGFVPGRRAELELDVTLRPATVEVVGRVVGPGDREVPDGRVALVPAGSAGSVPSDLVSCEPGGAFRLAGDRSGPHVLVAFLDSYLGPSVPALRPTARAVDLDEGVTTLEEPLVLDEGHAIEGVARGANGIPLQVTASPVEEGQPCPFGRLRRVNGRFEAPEIRALTGEDGSFRLTGLAAEEYEVTGRGFGWGGETIPSMWKGSGGRGWEEPLRVAAPAHDVWIQPGHPVHAFQVLSSGTPLEEAYAVRQDGSAWSQAHLRKQGRYVVAFPADEPIEILFAAPGHESRTVAIEPHEEPYPGWRPVELPVGKPWATLELLVTGDPQRTVELLSVRLLSESEGRPRPGFDTSRSFKRLGQGEPLVVDAIPSGRHRVRVEPSQNSPDDCHVLPLELEVDLAPGDTQTHEVVLRQGGRLRITTGPLEEEPLRFELLDDAGEEMHPHTALRSSIDGRGRRSWGNVYEGTNLTDPLPPGRYTVRVRLRGGQWYDHAVTVPAGHVVDVDVAP